MRTLLINVMADSTVTVARATLDGITVTASARREPGDRPDAAIGAELATARALAALSRRLERRARGAVRNADHVRAHRLERQAAKRDRAREELIAQLAGPSAVEDLRRTGKQEK